MEPIILRRGKLFHKRIQNDWGGTIEGKTVRPEHRINLATSGISKSSSYGRIDIFVDKMSDFVSIMEIKSTDWDKVKSQNVKRLLKSHLNQMFKYIDKFLELEKVSVCAVIIYPTAPKIPELKYFIESFFHENSFQIVWYDEN